MLGQRFKFFGNNRLVCAVIYALCALQIIAVPLLSYARDKAYSSRGHCKITPHQSNDYEPEIFEPSNNLLRKAGEQPIFCGQKIIITGKVLDQNCVALPDAKIYLWQVGCDGKYPYKPLRNRVNSKLLNLKTGSSFTGSGTATTNNEGEFTFITIAPPAQHASKGGRAAGSVNLRVEHRMLGSLQTKLHLSNKNIIEDDFELDEDLKTASEQAPVYNFQIVMPGSGLNRY